jgi:glycosyltransferase involved in cell wall biosynthesis
VKYAYFGIPHIGGTYTVYRSLRDGLSPFGVTVDWLGLGPGAQAAYDDPDWSHERGHGVVVAGAERDERRQAEALISYLESSNYDGVFVNVLAGRVETNAVRYLDHGIRRVMIVHNITPGTYAAARAVRDYVHAVIGVSPRIRDDLIERHGFSRALTNVIPNAVDLTQFVLPRVSVPTTSPIRMLFVGRISDPDKGVFWLPQIMSHLPPDVAHLTIGGDGPDLPALRERCSFLGERVEFIGRVSPLDVPALLAKHDVFIFPSRFEGLGLALVEAMAAGCVPVATRIEGVTDFVVNDGEDGYLFPIGAIRESARHIEKLYRDREALMRLSRRATAGVHGKFDIATMGRKYHEVLRAVTLHPIALHPSRSIEQWSYPLGLRPGLRTYVPRRLKNRLREWRERFSSLRRRFVGKSGQ